MSANLTFVDSPEGLQAPTTLALMGRRGVLDLPTTRALLPEALATSAWDAMVRRGDPGDDGSNRTTWLGGAPDRVIACVLPDVCSRHNAPSRSWAVTRLAKGLVNSGRLGLVVMLAEADHALATAAAIARAFPTFVGTSRSTDREVRVVLMRPDGRCVPAASLQPVADGVRRAGHLVDMPPNQLDTRAFVAEARQVAHRLPGVDCHTVVGEELQRQGLGGLWGVGRAASSPPALVVLDYTPGVATDQHDAWVGKGIVYDTGGLSIKTKTGMPGMKTDMGGAAAVLAAFEAAARMGLPRRITAVLCIAENAVGPDATRPDDILEMYSGRTVEVNNTDAEGRLVLADGVAWVTKNRTPTRILQLATLTGAQAMATGKLHAALYCSDDALEAEAVRAGRDSGDLTHALPYSPELFQREFASRVADMRNSVKDRSNAQSSCAGEFVRMHLPDDHVPWLHVDMAGPSVHGGRGTGYGVALLLALSGARA